MAEAFLEVELYAGFMRISGQAVAPRPAALERAFENYGVSPKAD